MSRALTAKQAADVLARAVALRHAHTTKTSLEELHAIANEAGVERQWVDQALAELDAPSLFVRWNHLTWPAILPLGWVVLAGSWGVSGPITNLMCFGFGMLGGVCAAMYEVDGLWRRRPGQRPGR